MRIQNFAEQHPTSPRDLRGLAFLGPPELQGRVAWQAILATTLSQEIFR
jgi:hypothetical protein